MKVIYFDCSMGAAGDMITAALLELHPSPEDYINRINRLGLPGIKVTSAPDTKCGITGTHVSVSYMGHTEDDREAHHHQDHDHHHLSVSDINGIIAGLDLPEKVKQDAVNVFYMIARAESAVHKEPVENIHFHELGTMDAVIDVLSVCLLVYELAPEKILASPVNVGGGTVKCAHGVLPVPAPATANILMGVPVYSGKVKSELCTPTGAALLKYFVSEFTDMPVMTVKAIGYGMGTKDFEAANCLRVFCGNIDGKTDEVMVLSCNLDDMTGESIGFACDRLFKAGALDVYTIPVNMKKSRPGVMLQCICKAENKEVLINEMFRHTSTLGVRISKCSRCVLERSIIEKDTVYGKVRFKQAKGWGVERSKPEYDDIAAIAEENGISIEEIKRNI